jgi:hypothetical protein
MTFFLSFSDCKKEMLVEEARMLIARNPREELYFQFLKYGDTSLGVCHA